jgi:uncharacterized protein
MARKRTSKPKTDSSQVQSSFAEQILNAKQGQVLEQIRDQIQNQLYGPVGLNNLNGLGPYGLETLQNGPAISDINTVFGNLRWYLISNLRQVLSQMYVEYGVIKTIVDVPVDDAFRKGIKVISKQLSEQQVQELHVAIDQDNDIGVYAQATKWNRLFGGAGVITLTGQDWEIPLDINAIEKDALIGFRAADMWELYGDRQNLENGEGNLEDVHSEFYSYYGRKIHKSRIHMMKGLEAPSFVRPRLRGWGFSIVETLLRSINQYLKTSDLTFEVLDEFKVDYYKFKGLVNTLLSPNGFQTVQQRIRNTNAQKNFNNAVVMDSEDDFQQKQISFQGIAETMTQIRMQVACDLRMPMTKIFGISSAGFSSGEDDIENYNAMVEGEVRAKAKRGLINMIEIRCKQLFDFVPDDITIEFESLRILSSEQEENVKNQKFSRLLQTVNAGLMSVKEFKDACNKENLLGIQIDTTMEKLELQEADQQGEQQESTSEDNVNQF